MDVSPDGTSLHEGAAGLFASNWHELAFDLFVGVEKLINQIIPPDKKAVVERGTPPTPHPAEKLPPEIKDKIVIIDEKVRERLYAAIRRSFKQFNIKQLTARLKDEFERGQANMKEETGRLLVAKPKKHRKERVRDKATEARDKWIYGQCCKLVPYDTIALRLNKKPRSWPRIVTKQGIRAAAEKYAARHNLPPIPARQDTSE